MNLFMFFCPSFLRDLSIKVWVFGLILTTVSHFSLAEQQWTAVYLTAAAAKYKNTSSSKTYNGNSIPIQVKAVSYTLADDYNTFFEGGLSYASLKNNAMTIKQQQYNFMMGRTIFMPNTYVFGALDFWFSKHSGDSNMSLSRHSIGVGIRQRFGDFAENFSGSVDLTIDYPISSSAKEGGTTWKPKPGIGYKLSVPLEWFVENSSWWILAEPYYRKFKMKASDTVSGTTYSESTHTFTGINIGVGADF